MGKARAKASQGVTLDAGALIALDRGDRRMIALLQQLIASSSIARIPAGVLGQAWRDSSRQAALARFLRTENVRIVALDEARARACGELCAATHTSDIIDASVVITARAHGDTIITSDVDDLRRLDPSANLLRV